MERNPIISLAFALLFCGFVLFPDGTGLKAQATKKASIKIEGDCLNCGQDRINKILANFSGINDLKLDPNAKTLSFTYNSTVSLIDVQLELSMNGYDAGDFKRSINSDDDPCCSQEKTMRGTQTNTNTVLGLDEAGPVEEDEDFLDLDSELQFLENEEIEEELRDPELILEDEEEDDFDLIIDPDEIPAQKKKATEKKKEIVKNGKE